MPHVDPWECMFCHGDLHDTGVQPSNLAFIAHLDDCPDCGTQFEAWTAHMSQDYIGY